MYSFFFTLFAHNYNNHHEIEPTVSQCITLNHMMMQILLFLFIFFRKRNNKNKIRSTKSAFWCIRAWNFFLHIMEVVAIVGIASWQMIIIRIDTYFLNAVLHSSALLLLSWMDVVLYALLFLHCRKIYGSENDGLTKKSCECEIAFYNSEKIKTRLNLKEEITLQ